MYFNANVVDMVNGKNRQRGYWPGILLLAAVWWLPVTTWASSSGDIAGYAGFPLATQDALPSHTLNPLQLALNDGQAMPQGASGQMPADDWQEPWFTGNKAHKYMGLGSLLLAGLTVLTAPDDDDEGVVAGAPAAESSDDSLHQGLANGALALGLGAVASGLIYHLDDISWDNGITDPDNLHMLLGLLGVAGYAAAVANGGEGGHSTAGIVGGLSMIGAIKLEW